MKLILILLISQYNIIKSEITELYISTNEPDNFQNNVENWVHEYYNFSSVSVDYKKWYHLSGIFTKREVLFHNMYLMQHPVMKYLYCSDGFKGHNLSVRKICPVLKYSSLLTIMNTRYQNKFYLRFNGSECYNDCDLREKRGFKTWEISDGVPVTSLRVLPSDFPLIPIKVFHRPNLPKPYIFELHVCVQDNFRGNFRDAETDLIRTLNILKKVQAIFSQVNIVIVPVMIELGWTMSQSIHILMHRRFNIKERVDCVHYLIIEDPLIQKYNSRVCQSLHCYSFSQHSISTSIDESAYLMAYELAQTFGLTQDFNECLCPQCIMSPKIEQFDNIIFSECSKKIMQANLEMGIDSCLYDYPSQRTPKVIFDFELKNNSYISSLMVKYDFIPEHLSINSYDDLLCGNEILDPGEECDCGLESTCPSDVKMCCNPRTCRFINNAECAGGPCCEITMSKTFPTTATCKLRPAGTVCKEADGSCDLPEYCTGTSEWCPADLHKIDGEECYTKSGYKSYCVKGGCLHSKEWCKVLWGETGEMGSDECFQQNTKYPPDNIANCGTMEPKDYYRFNRFVEWDGNSCQKESKMCGRLWCYKSSEKNYLIKELKATSFKVAYEEKSCHALKYDNNFGDWSNGLKKYYYDLSNLKYEQQYFGADMYYAGYSGAHYRTVAYQDAGMVPSGTPCPYGMCYNASCTRLEDVNPQLRAICKKCGDKGICNNRGNCHCHNGYAPPDCVDPGLGGSVDSGPPPKPTITPTIALMIGLLIFFILILPLFVYVMYRVLCQRENGKLSFVKQYDNKGALIGCFDENCFKNLCRKKSFSGLGQTPKFAIPSSNSSRESRQSVKPDALPEIQSLADQKKQLQKELKSIVSNKPSYLLAIESAWEKTNQPNQKAPNNGSKDRMYREPYPSASRLAPRASSSSYHEYDKSLIHQQPSVNQSRMSTASNIRPSRPAPKAPSQIGPNEISHPIMQSSTYKNSLVERKQALKDLPYLRKY